MKINHRKTERGLTLIEVMVVLLIVTVLGGVIFSQINTVQQRAASEEQKLDIFQETRDFMDQMTRDLHQAGYPNMHNFAPGQLLAGTSTNCVLLADPTTCDQHVAIGLVKIDKDRLYFEGDVDGNGTVSEVVYQLSATGPNCPCLRRSQQAKTVGNPLPTLEGGDQGAPVFYTEIQGVQNGTTASPIFYAYRADNTQVTSLPVDINSNAADIASINQIKVIVTAQSQYTDLKSGVKPSVTMVSTVRLNNCSAATSGQAMSCQ
jgi:prepilin-type N-terminal cleavage/methylation domain-containing protein